MLEGLFNVRLSFLNHCNQRIDRLLRVLALGMKFNQIVMRGAK